LREREFSSFYENIKKEIKYFQKKWKGLLDSGDPYYNPNLNVEREDFSLNVE